MLLLKERESCMLVETQYNFLEEGGLTVGGGIELDQIQGSSQRLGVDQ